MCKFLRIFTVPIMNKIDITIDINGSESQLLSLKYSKIPVSTMIIVDNLHCNLFHTLM